MGVPSLEKPALIQYQKKWIRFGEYHGKWYCGVDIAWCVTPNLKRWNRHVSPDNMQSFSFPSIEDLRAGDFLFLNPLGVTQLVGSTGIPISHKRAILKAIFPDQVESLRKELARESWTLEVDRKSLKNHYHADFGIIRTVMINEEKWFIATDIEHFPRINFHTPWLPKRLSPKHWKKLCLANWGNCIAGIKAYAIDYEGIIELMPMMTEEEPVRKSLDRFLRQIINGDQPTKDTNLEEIRQMLADIQSKIGM